MRRLVSTLLLLSLALTLPALVLARGEIPPPSFGKPIIKQVPPKPMYAYINGVRTTFTQSFKFVAFRFRKPLISKPERQEYYKRLRLVVSEISDPGLMARNMWAVRLTEGADERRWNIFTEYMRSDPEVDVVGRVFSRRSPDGTEELLVAGPDIQITFAHRPNQAELDQVVGAYPLVLRGHDPLSLSAVFSIADSHVDTIDLADRIHESGRYKAAEPQFLVIHGKAVTEEYRQQVMKGYESAKPPEIKAPAPPLPQYNPELQHKKGPTKK